MNSKAFMKTQSYREIQEGWRWMKDADPEAAAAAIQWTKDHPEAWKEIERMLYYSEANFHRRFAFDELEDAEMKQPPAYNPEAFLPEEIRNSIYQDKCWFDRSEYLPEGSDEDPFMYLNVDLVEKLKGLTEFQREVLFRNVINGESTESIAQDKQCTSRNIRDIRSRALKQLRTKSAVHEGSGYTSFVVFVILAMLAVIFGLKILAPIYPWLVYVVGAILVLTCILIYPHYRENEVAGLLRLHWASLHRPRKKKKK